MGEVPGSIPGEGSTVVGDYPLRERSVEPSDPDPLRPRRGTAAASAAPGKPAAADRKTWASVDVAQLVARLVANEKAAGSIPVIRTRFNSADHFGLECALHNARLAEMEDAPVSGTGVREGVGVRVP